jgi:hypothetical protein
VKNLNALGGLAALALNLILIKCKIEKS